MSIIIDNPFVVNFKFQRTMSSFVKKRICLSIPIQLLWPVKNPKEENPKSPQIFKTDWIF
jgi:hypothetical protein